MYKKPSSPLYANVSGVNYKNEVLEAPNEPTYYNTVTYKAPKPSHGIYSNVVNYPTKPNNIYSNVTETAKPDYKSSQYVLYDNLKPIGLLLFLFIFVLFN